MAEMRAQELQPCRREPNDCRYAEDGWCGSDECNGDGTRWVTVGVLRQPERGGKKAVLFQKLNDWWPEKVPVDSKRGTPLYAIEENTDG